MHHSISQLSNTFLRTFEHAANLVFPPRCLGCNRYHTSLQPTTNTDSASAATISATIVAACPTCRPTIYRLDGPGCPQCARPRVDFPGKPAAGVDELCASCLERPPAFEKAWACFEYDGIIAEAIQSIKYAQQLHKTRTITHLTRPWMLEKLAEIQQTHPDSHNLCLIPVPMHIRDLRRRGFNPAALILQQITHKTPYKTRQNAVRKVRHTPPQAGLTRGERLRNLRDAFIASPPPTPDTTAVVFDDVLTTTATTHEVSTALLNAGYRRAIVLTLARATGSGRLSDY